MLRLKIKDSFSAEAERHAYDIQMLHMQSKEMKVWFMDWLLLGSCMQAELQAVRFNAVGASLQVFYLSYLDGYHLCQQ